MAESSSRTLVCSILFVDLVGYSRTSVQEQLRQKQALNLLIAESLGKVRQIDRVILDTGDGAAITFLSDPEDALVSAIAMRARMGDLRLRMGIHLGPVRLVKDLNGQTNIVGDGINAAQRIMSFADPGQLLVSRSFHEVVARLSDEHARLFTAVGVRTDKNVREHEVFAVGSTAAAPSALIADGSARIFDAGPHLIISGYNQAKVAHALDQLARKGARVVSPVTQVGEKWMASCEHPEARLAECRVEALGYTRVITGPTRQAVSHKVDEFLRAGDRLVGEIEEADEGWIAICDTAAGR